MIFILFVQVCPWDEWRRFRGIYISTTRSTIRRSQLSIPWVILISIITNRIFSLLPSFFFFLFHAFATIKLFFFSIIFLVYAIPFNIYLFCYQSPILYQNIVWSQIRLPGRSILPVSLLKIFYCHCNRQLLSASTLKQLSVATPMTQAVWMTRSCLIDPSKTPPFFPLTNLWSLWVWTVWGAFSYKLY